MRKSLLALSVFLLLCLSVSFVFALETITFSSTEVNNDEASKVSKDLGKVYKTWDVKIINYLTYSNLSGQAHIELVSTSGVIIDVLMQGYNNYVSVWLKSGGSVKLCEKNNGWYTSKAFSLILNSEGLTIYDSNSTKLIQNYGLGDFQLESINAYSSDAENPFSGGYITVEVTTALPSVTSILMNIMPALVLVIALSVVFKAIEKIMKKVNV